MDFSTWLRSAGYAEDQLTAQMRKHLGAAWRAETGTTAVLDPGLAASSDDAIEIAAAVDAEIALCQHDPEKRSKLERIGNTAITEGWSVRDAKLAVRRAGRSYPISNVHPGSGGLGSADVLACSLAIEAGLSTAAAGGVFSPSVVDAATAKENRGATLHSVMRAVLQVHGQRIPTRFSDSDIRTVFELSKEGMRAEGPSTITVPGILSNVANKMALAGYSSVPTTWQRFCITRPLNNFKSHTFYRLTGGGQFERVSAGGEIKHSTLTESSYALAGDTYGKIIAIDRRNLINDDLGMLSTTPQVLGRMAALKLEQSVFETLIGNAGSPAFFSTDNGNIQTSGSSALGLPALVTAYQKFQEQLDANSQPVMITPSILLTPPALEMTARSIINSQLVIAGTASATQPNSNIFSGMFVPISSPWLAESTGLASASDKAWYLLTGANDFSVIQVGFVGGQESPTIQSFMMDEDRLGLTVRAYHDFGVSLFEPRGGVLSAGQ